MGRERFVASRPSFRPTTSSRGPAKILLNRKHHDTRRVLAHDVGHVPGIGSISHPALADYVDTNSLAVTGPEAMKTNGG